MAITATQANKEYQNAPVGNHIARIFSIVHEGVIPTTYMGEPKETDTVRIGWELPNEKMENGQPFAVYQEYTLSMGEKANLRKLVHGIIGQGLMDAEAKSFEVTELMGRVCMLNVVHNEKGYPKVMGAAPLPKGIDAPEAINPEFILDFDENWSEEKMSKMPQFVQDKVKSSRNYVNKFRDIDNEDAFDSHVSVQSVADMDFSANDDESDNPASPSFGIDPKV